MTLIPCPFCGSHDVQYENDTGPHDDYFREWIECHGCGATCPTAEIWNSRANQIACSECGVVGGHFYTCSKSREQFYKPEEITECPSCGCKEKDTTYPKCWHCAKCGFAICEHYKHELDEIRRRRENKK